MSNNPSDLRYTKDHEWIRSTGNAWRVGITDFAQKQLGDIVFVELPKVGYELETGDSFGSIESVKSVSELFAPVSGKVTAVNTSIADDPELVNTDTYTDGWLIEIEPSNKSELDSLLTVDEYEKFTLEEPSQ